MNYAVITCGPDFTIESWNPAAAALFQWEPGHSAQHNLIVEIFPEADRTEAARKLHESAPTEFRIARKDGSHFDGILLCSPLQNSSGVFCGWAASLPSGPEVEFRNITERIHQVHRLESVATLAGGIAHDFNNLLTGIVGNTTLALEALNPTDEAQPFLREVLAASEEATRLTRRMLTYAGRGPVSMVVQELTPILNECLAHWKGTKRVGIKLVLELVLDLPMLRGDREQLRQTISNLIENASEAIDDGDGTIYIRTRVNDPVDRASGVINNWHREDGFVAVEIQDTGSGMDDATLASIFDPSFTTRSAGRGLGLAAVQTVVRRHSGTILISSKVGRGTSVRLLLPSE